MNIPYKTIYGIVISALVLACNNNEDKADAYGNFESTEIIVSAEGNGKIMALGLEEGDRLKENEVVGYIDTTQLALKKDQLQASRKTIASQSASVLSQIDVYEEQEKTLEIDKQRVVNLLKDSAATQKQLDDINGKLNVLQQQEKNVRVQNAAVLNEIKGLDAQIRQVEDQIKKSVIVNPTAGTVLVKYAEPGEVASFGKPLYKIADMQEMILRVYVSETQLSSLKIGENVQVKIDAAEGTRTMDGKITWISSTAEFTPKVIQTKEERVNLVYAVKVSLKNDGSLKIGMPGEMWIP